MISNRRIPISVIVPVKNEGAILRTCLEHLQWADEIVVVDSGSTDDTVDVARRAGAQVAQFHFNGVFPKKKNWALENLSFRNEWVLIVDADEHIPPVLAEEIASVIQRGDVDGFFINRRFFFLGEWIRRCGYYPSWNLRLFRHEKGRYEQVECAEASTGDNEVHEHVILRGRAEYLKNDMLHYAYPNIGVWVEKHNRYSEWEAHAARRLLEPQTSDRLMGRKLYWKRVLKRIYLRLPLRFVFRFVYAYVIRLGILDGRAGFIFCGLLSFYDFLSWAKAFEFELASSRADKRR